MSKYRDDVKHDLIDGKWITKNDIDNHNKLLDAPLRDEKGRFKKKESQKGDDKCQVHNDTQKVLPT